MLTVDIPTGSPNPNGDVAIYLEVSTDEGLTWPDEAAGYPVARLNFTAAGTKRIAFMI